MRIARPIRAAFRQALAPGLAALLLAAAGCSSNTLAPPPPLPPLSRVEIAPVSDSLAVDGTRLFTATAYDTADIAVGGAGFAWSTTNAAVLTVSGTGLVTARGEGVASVIAAAGGRSDTATVFVYTQPGWYAQSSNTVRDLNGVFFQPDGRTGVAVGALGAVVRTTDAGETWTTVTSGTTNDLHDVWFTSATTGWIAGDAGTVLRTSNGGASWSRVLNVGASENLRGVRFADASRGWFVGSGGVVVRTANGGTSWTRTHPTAATLHSVAFSDTSNGWAVGTGGVILGTHDGGRSWYVVQPAVTALALESVWRRSNTLAWGAGAAGARVSTQATADSLDWSAASFGASNDLRGIMFPTDAIGYAVGWNSGGIVLKTVNGGATWSAQQSNSAQGLNAVFFVDPLRGWAVGDAGRIVHTSKGGNL